MKALVLLAACLLLQEVSRDVLQAHPLLERVVTIEWCTDKLLERAVLRYEGKALSTTDVNLWPPTTFAEPTWGGFVRPN